MMNNIININEQRLVLKYNGDPVTHASDVSLGSSIFVFDENTRREYVVRGTENGNLVVSDEVSIVYCMDVYVYNEDTNRFEFLATEDPENLLADGSLVEGDIIFLAKPGTTEPTYIEDSIFSDIFGMYIITETVDSYIEECYDIYFDEQEETDDEEDEEDEAQITFVPLKPFFMWLKDKSEIMKVGKKVFQESGSGIQFVK